MSYQVLVYQYLYLKVRFIFFKYWHRKFHTLCRSGPEK